MVERFLLPHLRKTFPSRRREEAHLHFVGVPESVVDHRIRPIIASEKSVHFTILAHLGLVDFDIFVSDASRTRARRRLAHIVNKIRSKMGAAFYGMDENYPLEKVVMNQFIAKKATLAIAESCTGGMLSQRLTDIPGSSAYFLGGVVSYSNHVKMSQLGVSAATLRVFGAVSKQSAEAMARGAREKCGSTWGLGITGIAGPGGATKGKSVGLVYIGLAGPKTTKSLEFHFGGTRDAVRQRAVIAALDLLRLIYL
jgi:nicotinamide-nucleotide amidase